ncbi:hypothetical protein V6U77_28060 [Micromonospora sp. CPCC 205546]|uniref:hypothetical protein n=1 Tax=Micromonospora sp. CPCC 205546 TaxID=3122397 RepID=UPI002FF1987F
MTSSVGSGKTAWFAALNAILTRLNDERCYYGDGPDHWQPAAIETLLPPAAVHATRTSGITTWGELAQQVNRLLTNQAGLLHELTGPTADLYRNGLVAGNFPAQHLRDALRALDVTPPQLFGSYRRAVRVYYSSHTHELDVDLCVALDRPNVPLAPDDGRPEDGDQRERLWAMVTPPGTCPDLVGLDVDGYGEDRPSETGGVNQSGTAQGFVSQVKDYGTEPYWRRLALLSTPIQPLLVLWTCSDAGSDWQPALPGLDPEDSLNFKHRQPASTASAGEDSTPARNSQLEVYDFSLKE